MLKKLLITFAFLLLSGFIILMRASTPSSGIIAKRDGDFTPLRPTAIKNSRSIASQKSKVVSGIVRSIKDVESCLRSSCSYPNNDPREYEIAVYRDLHKKLNNLYHKILDNETQSESISKIARYYLSFEDGYVKESALNLMSTQPPSSENFNALTQHVFDFHDPLIAKQGMAELLKYRELYPDEISSLLVKTLTTGGISVRESISRELASFITKQNLGQYIALKSRYQSGSKVHRLISMAIVEFENR